MYRRGNGGSERASSLLKTSQPGRGRGRIQRRPRGAHAMPTEPVTEVCGGEDADVKGCAAAAGRATEPCRGSSFCSSAWLAEGTGPCWEERGRRSGTRAAGCFHLGCLRESLCCGGATLGRWPGPWVWELQPRKPGSDQPWVRPLLGAGTPRFPRFALDLAILNLRHLLPPHGTRRAGAAPGREAGGAPQTARQPCPS